MDQTLQTFVNRMGAAAEAEGMSPIASRLFALLLLSDAPLSLDELAERLDVSKASVSTEARRLLDRQVVERVPVAGDRRDYYQLTPDFFAQVIRSRVDRWRRFHASVESLRGTPSASSAVVRRRLDSVKDIQSALVDRIDGALLAWERQVRTQPAPRRRRTT